MKKTAKEEHVKLFDRIKKKLHRKEYTSSEELLNDVYVYGTEKSRQMAIEISMMVLEHIMSEWLVWKQFDPEELAAETVKFVIEIENKFLSDQQSSDG